MDIGQLIQAFTAFSVMVGVIISFINRNKIRELHVTLNSRLDQLLAATAAQARSEGHAEGLEEGRRPEDDN